MDNVFRRLGLCTGTAVAGFGLAFALAAYPTAARAAADDKKEEKKEEAKKEDAPKEGTAAETGKAERELGEQYDQFVTFLLQQARYDIASNLMEAMLKAPVDDATFVKVFERNRGALKQLEAIAANIPRIKAELEGSKDKDQDPQKKRLLELCNKYPEFWNTYTEKRSKVARDPNRIAELAKWLGKSEPVFREASSQLKLAGAHAMPVLISAISGSDDNQLRLGVERCIKEYLQSDAVDGLLAAMRGSKQDKVKEFCAIMLGDLGFRAAAPQLRELATDASAKEATRGIAQKAFLQVTHPGQQSKTVAQLYTELSEGFFNDAVTPRPTKAATTDVWVWEGERVTPKKVSYDAYIDAMARRAAWDALRTAPQNEQKEAWGLLLCSYHRFEAKQRMAAAMEADPLKAVERWLESDYTTNVAGPARIITALKRGLNPATQQTGAHVAMNIKLLQALSLTGGMGILRENPEAVEVLSMGLTHPNQVIRIETAINTVRMHPGAPAELWNRVVPALSEAVSLLGKETVLIISEEQKIRDGLSLAFKEGGYLVEAVDSVSKATELASQRAGFAAIVYSAALDNAAGFNIAKQLAANPALEYAHKVILTPSDRLKDSQASASSFVGVHAVDASLEAKAIVDNTKTVSKSGYVLDEKASEDYALKAIDLLARMAAAGDIRVFNFRQGEASLIAALDGDPRDSVASAAGRALGLYPTASAQRALAGAAAKKGRDPVRLAALAGLAESGRKFRNQMRERVDTGRVEALGNLSQDKDASQELRTAAAAALGALELSGGKVFELLSTAPQAGN